MLVWWYIHRLSHRYTVLCGRVRLVTLLGRCLVLRGCVNCLLWLLAGKAHILKQIVKKCFICCRARHEI